MTVVVVRPARPSEYGEVLVAVEGDRVLGSVTLVRAPHLDWAPAPDVNLIGLRLELPATGQLAQAHRSISS